MMYTVNYVYSEIGRISIVNHIGSAVEIAERTVIKFACLEDALAIARMMKTKGYNVFVGDTNDSEARYLIPRESMEF